MCFRPDTRARRLEQVNLYVLRHVGIKLILLDADNTLTKWNSPDVSDEVASWVQTAKQMGFGLAVVSNNRAQRLQALSTALEINCMPSMKKPLPFGIRGVAKMVGVKPNQCAMIGDQLLTDILAGNLAGMHTVLLDPIDLSAEFKGTRINRKIEKVVKKLWRII